MSDFRLKNPLYYLFFNGLLVLFILTGCNDTLQLNSERIAQRYGNYEIEILYADDARRISNLYSENNGRKTMRTLALVEFVAAGTPEIAREHQQILGGGSIGAVFKEAGWTIEKRSSQYCLSQSDIESMPELQKMNIQFPATLATRIYVFHVRKAAMSVDYAIITEIYHPDYLQTADLANGYLDDC